MSRSRDAAETPMQEPLTPAMFHVLLALADGEKHGYAILKEVARRTEGKVQAERWDALRNHQAAECRGLDCGIDETARRGIGR